MTMQQRVDWYGRQTLWRIGVGHAAYHPACPCVPTASRLVTTVAMTSTCFAVRQAGHVIVETSV